MQNFGNYNVNPNTPIYVGGGKKKVKKQSEDKPLGEKVAIGVASTAGAIAAILIGYGIINGRTGNKTKITQSAKEAVEAVAPKAKGAGKKTADIIKGKGSSTQSTYVLLKNYVQQLNDNKMTYAELRQNAIVLNSLLKMKSIKEHGVELFPLVKQYSRFFSTLLDTYKNKKDSDKVNLNEAEKKSLDKIQTTQIPLLEQIENIIAINNFFENFKLENIVVEKNKLKCGDMTTGDLDKDVKSTDLHPHEVYKKDDYMFYLDYADGTKKEQRVNGSAYLYIKDKDDKFTKIKLSTIKEKLNQVTEVDEFITSLDDYNIGELKFIPKGRKKQNASDEPVPCLTGFTKDDDEKSYAIKLDDLLDKDAAQLKALMKDPNKSKKLTDDILSKIFKCATPEQLYHLMNDADWKDKLVTSGDSPTLTEVGKAIVGAAIRDTNGNIDSGKIVTMLKEIKDLDTKGSVGAAVVNYLIGCGNVTADMLNQVMINEDLKDKLVTSGDSPTLTEVGKAIVGAAIRDTNGNIDSGKIITMLNGFTDLTEGSVGAAVVDHLLGREDVTADILYGVLTSADMIEKLTTTIDDARKLTVAGAKIMNKATEKGLTFEQLFNISQSNSKLVFEYNEGEKSFKIQDEKLIITNLPRTMFYYLKQQQQQGKDLTLETILFKQYLSAAGISACIDEKSGALKTLGDWNDSYVNNANQNSQAEYNPSELLVNHYVTLVKDGTDSDVKKALEGDASFALQTPTTLGQVLASDNIKTELVEQSGDNAGKLTEAGKAIVEAAIVHDTTGLEQNAKDKKQQENIVELLSNFGSFGENTVGAAVINHLMDHKDVTAEMLGQALNDSELKAKFFNESTSEGTTTYSLTPAGQHMIKQAAKTYNNNDNNSFSRFLKNLNVANYFNVIYDILAKNEDNYISSQACWFLQILISDTSVSEEDKKVLHEIIKNKCINDFNLNDHSDTCYTNQNRDLTISGISELILFANSQSNVFIGAAETTTSDVLKNLKKKKEFTITINNVKFKYIIDETNHKVYYRQK